MSIQIFIALKQESMLSFSEDLNGFVGASVWYWGGVCIYQRLFFFLRNTYQVILISLIGKCIIEDCFFYFKNILKIQSV